MGGRLRWIPPLPKKLACPKNFLSVFGYFTQIIPLQVDRIWETLRLRSDPN